MTDFTDKENSIDQSEPYELFEFVGSYSSYYMTSDLIAHLFNGKVFNPVPGLKRSGIKIVTHEEDSADISISIPINEQIVKDYAFQTTPPLLKIAIYRLQRNALAFEQIHSGQINSISISDEFATFKTPNSFSDVLQGSMPTVYIQPSCNNVLFDQRCKLSRTANSVQTVVSIVDGNKITVASIGSFPNGKFIGGEIAIPSRNERRMIVAQSGQELTVNYAFYRISQGTSVEVTVGCDHSYSGSRGCSSFNNQINFGGFPFIPGESNNPFKVGIK